MLIKFSLFFLLSGCSYFIAKIDTPLVSEQSYLKNLPEVPSYCPITQQASLQLIGSAGNSQQVYPGLSEKLGPSPELLDHFALWGLLQLSVRPDQSSPTSRLQVMLHHNGPTHYFDFFSEFNENQYPYLYGIEWILKKFNHKRKLEYYARILDQHLGQKLKVGKDLENFLFKNQAFIRANKDLAPYFFRGAEVLKENETAPVLNFGRIVREYRRVERDQKPTVNTSLVQFVTESGNSGSCNYDFNLYDNSIFLIDKSIPVANLFGLSSGKGAFLASSSQKLDKANSFYGMPVFKGESKVRSSAVCVIEEGPKKIWTFSNQSRDPGQHLFHLVRYGLSSAQSISEVDRLLRHSRHLFLSDPVRLIIESQRSRPNQIENLLKLNLPIYNAQKLGNVWAYARFNDQERFIMDDRNPGTFTCR